ncbi:MAG: urea carboxylase-associated family protein [Kiloniellales bacterium]|nr:urea carboxylase-associated family protein [Kiloniellales bacterium]
MTEPELTRLAARTGTAMRVARGEALRIVNLYGSQVVDCWAFNAEDLDEWMSMPHTRNACRRLTPAVGESFVTNLRRPILTLAEDTSPGVHDTLIPCCDAARYKELGCEDHANCADNMADGLRKLGIAPPLPPAPLNLFMNVPVGPTGRLEIAPPVSAPDDHVVLRAEMDVIVALSACPHDIFPVNGADATPRDVAYAVRPAARDAA